MALSTNEPTVTAKLIVGYIYITNSHGILGSYNSKRARQNTKTLQWSVYRLLIAWNVLASSKNKWNHDVYDADPLAGSMSLHDH